ncbi:MAG: hypothetical protein GY757_59760, partial [bacterium]|nr:hypothetical protein [bacterium]
MVENEKKNMNENQNRVKGEKVLLALLPFWDPQIPSLGIACLQSYLRKFHYDVKAVDANIEIYFRDLFDDYFAILKEIIPTSKQGNIFNIGNQVLRNHLMARLNYPGEERYVELVKIVVKKTFFTNIDDNRVNQLDRILVAFYDRLEKFVLDLLEKEKPTVLGLTVYGDTLPASLAAFKMAKKWNPSIKTIMGGGIFADQLAPGSPNLDYFAQQTSHYIDKIVIGEGEESILSFLRGELENVERVLSYKDISANVLDISKVDVPYFFDFDLNYYPHLAHYGARSCPFQCKFCSETINWGKYRKKSVNQTVSEFVQLYEKHSCQLYLLTDSTLNPVIT